MNPCVWVLQGMISTICAISGLRNDKKCQYIDGLMQERRNSTANALELRLSCTNHWHVYISQTTFTRQGFDKTLSYCITSEQGKSEGFDSCDRPSNFTQIGFKSLIFQPVWPWNLMDELEQGKSEGFESCDRPTVRKCPIWVKIGDVLYRVTLKFDGWPWKTIGHLSFAVSSFVQHFIAIGEFKLELQSGNTQFGSNLRIFRAVWPWNLTDDLQKQ